MIPVHILGWKYKFGHSENNSYISVTNKLIVMGTSAKLKLTLNILFFTSIIGLAISYVSQLLYPYVPKIGFLEAVGIYCLWTPINHFVMGISRDDEE